MERKLWVNVYIITLILTVQSPIFIIYSMKRILLPVVAALCCLCNCCNNQTRTELYNKFNEAIDSRDTTAVTSVISDWERAFPNDAELYSLQANKYFLSAMTDVIAYTQNEEEAIGEYMVANDSAGVETHIYSYTDFDPEKISLGAKVLAEGIAKHPDRLDFRLGKVTLHLKMQEHALAVQEIYSALEHSVINKNQWTSTLDAPIETDGVSYLRDCIQEYLSHFLNAGDLTSAESMVDKCLDVYPQDAVFIADKGALKYFADELEEALKWYIVALEIAPNDMMIATNIGNIYNDLGDKQNAIKYYSIVAESSDMEYEDYIRYAKSKIQELSSSK